MENSLRLAPEIRAQAQIWILAVIAVVLVGWAMRAMTVVIVPIVLSIFVALVVAPISFWIRARVPDRLGWLGPLAGTFVVVLALLIFFAAIWLAAERVILKLPDSISAGGALTEGSASDQQGAGDQRAGGQDAAAGQEDARGQSGAGAQVEAAGRTGGSGQGPFSNLFRAFSEAGGSLTDRVREFARQSAGQVLGSVATVLGGLALVVFLTLLMLLESERWREKGRMIFGGDRASWSETVGVIARKLRRYLLARTALGLLTALLYTGWLFIFDVDLLIVWALLAFLLNYIPNFGSLIAGALPVLYVFVTRDLQTAIIVGLGILAIEQVVGNFIDPRVQGRQVQISPLVVLISLVLWGWIWGVVGAILAVPLMISFLVIFAHLPTLRPFALALSSSGDVDELDRSTRS